MPVSKRTRFEVLKRDNYACRYCRSTESPLTVDHVLPVALGGTDDPTNLVAACRDRNAGKASTAPDDATVAEVAEDALRWSAAIRQAADEAAAERGKNVEVHRRFQKEWTSWGDKELEHLPSDYRQSINGWLDAGLTEDDLLDGLAVAMSNRGVRFADVFRYMAGINRNKVAKLHERARQIMEGDADGA